MSIVTEITRIQNAKSTLKTKLNAKNDEQHQITNETIDEYGDFVDSIQSSNIIGATAEGESLSLANTKAMPYSDYVVEGKSEQETRSGINKFDITNAKMKPTYSGTNPQITTNSNNFQMYNQQGDDWNGIYIDGLDSTKKYTVCLYATLISNTSSGASKTAINGVGNNYNSYDLQLNNKTKIIYTISSSDKIYIVLAPKNTILYEDVMIVEGKYTEQTIPPYEPYGASPSPEYPSEIHSVADDVNLLSGLSIYTNSHTISPKLELDTGTYTFSYTGEPSSGIYIRKNDAISGEVLLARYNTTEITFTVAEKGDYYIDLYLSGDWHTKTLTNAQLKKGSTLLPYSPYNQGTVTIKQRGKNWFDVGSITDYTYNQSLTTQNNAITNIIKSGATTNAVNNNKLYINNFYISANYDKNDNTPRFIVQAYDSNNNLITSGASNWSYNSYYGGFYRSGNGSFSLSTASYVKIGFVFVGTEQETNENGTYSNIMISTEQLPYEPYQGNYYTIQTEPLRSLPNGVKDTIEADGIHRRVGRVVLDGTQPLEIVNWRPTETSVGWVYLRSITNNKKQTEGVINNILCNKLKAVSYTSLFGNTADEGINIVTQSNAYGLVIKTKDTSLTTANAINTYLSSNPITVQYELETEIIEPLTQNQATTMLDIIKTGSYEGTTNIYTDEDVKPTMKVDYYKKG